MRPAIDEAVEFSGMNKTTFINGDIMEKINKGGKCGWKTLRRYLKL